MTYVDDRLDSYSAFDRKDIHQIIADTKGYIAGGCFKDLAQETDVKDYDVFFYNYEAYKYARSEYTRLGKSHHRTRHAEGFEVSYTDTIVELVDTSSTGARFADPRTLISNFDFTVTKMAVYAGTTNYRIVYHTDFFKHLWAREMVIPEDVVIHNPVSMVSRAMKYSRYGFTIQQDSLSRLLSEVTKMGPTAPSSVKNILDSYSL